MDTLYIFPILLFSIIIHEIAHGWMALKLGDPTAQDMGRLTLNPIPHIDPIGSILIPLISYFAAGTVFIAWAKPVPVNPANFRNLRRDDILVSIVGPASNLVVAFACVIMFIATEKLTGTSDLQSAGLGQEAATYLGKMFYAGIPLNIFLAVFNLIPVPPLDGSHVLASLLPQSVAHYYRQVGFAGILFIIILMRLAPVWHTVLAIVQFVMMPYIAIVNVFR
ncbi:MAG TPA: site-2 protease family protein [Bacteroidota bacterium]